MRAFLACLLLTACGRLGFDELDDDVGGGLTILTVRPAWSMAAGGTRIEIELAEAVGQAEVAIDGMPCASLAIIGATLQCDVPAHAPGLVPLEVRSDAVVDQFEPFVYVTAGGYQHGGIANDRTSGAAVDRAGNVYVAGVTDGSLGGPLAGDFDAVLVKYNAAGQLAWVRQLGSPLLDYARDVAVDPVTDSPTLIGHTAGAIGSTPNAGGDDVFVARYTPEGDLAWVTQTGSPGDDQGWDLAIDASGATVAAARTRGSLDGPNAGGVDYAVVRYTADGALDWIHQGGTNADDTGHSIAVAPDGTSYIVGYTLGDLVGSNAGVLDLFVAEIGVDGTAGWIRQRGTPANDQAFDATIDSAGDVWISGLTAGALDGQTNRGGDDLFVMRFAADGAWIHTRQYGGTSDEISFGIAVSAAGSVYVSCNTSAGFDGASIIGNGDVCMISADRSGNHQWTTILGSTDSDGASSCAVDPFTGLVYVPITTTGSFDGQPGRGGEDIALVKLDASGAVR